MNKLLHFFSVALLTQVVLMLSQLILLPMQIRLWGHAVTAQWYAALALANVTSVVDLGLRTAGHAELLEHVKGQLKLPAAGEYFRQIWSWIRLLMLSLTVMLIAAQACYTSFFEHTSYPLWKAAVILAYALETLLVIRIVYLDTLGLYRGAETSYFVFALLRLLLSVPAILVFHLQASGLAYVLLATSAAGVAFQGLLLCRSFESLQILSPLPSKLSLKILLLSRLTVGEPFSNWVRLNLPVVVISAIAPPAAVTTFVGLRAAFGAARTSIQQLARVASVEYLRFRAEGRGELAASLLLVFILVGSLVATTASIAVITDNMRLLGLWLSKVDIHLFQQVEIAFVLSAPFYAYQIPLNLFFRLGELAKIARRHYAYSAVSCLLAFATLRVANFPLYLGLLAATEIALSLSFMLARKRSADDLLPVEAQRGWLFCAIGSFLALITWLAVHSKFTPFVFQTSPLAVLETIAFASAGILALIFAGYAANPAMVRSVRPLIFRQQPVINPAAI